MTEYHNTNVERIIFMGFCEGGDIHNRSDEEWKKKQICEFHFTSSSSESAKFAKIQIGDLLVLKKNEEFQETMKLYGHGRVRERISDTMLNVEWSSQNSEITVPAMGCVQTVCIRETQTVHAHPTSPMPSAFWSWLLVK